MQIASRNLRVRFVVAGALLSALSAVAGCNPPPEHTKDGDKKAGTCTSVGQQCEFSPGKLGACVMPTGCTDDGCLICQSQH